MILILDNYDSFTFNLYQYFGQLGEHIEVLRPDVCTISRIKNLQPELIVISPGPCSPNEAVLATDVIKHFQGKIPILGICLGHQAIGQVFGAKVIRANTPVHGKVSKINHDETGIFQGVPNPLQVTRYHSLALQKDTIPDDFIISAVTEDGQVMGIRHCTLPIEGVQFHPEAILTQYGLQLLASAIRDARKWIEQNHKQNHKQNHRYSYQSVHDQTQNHDLKLTNILSDQKIKTKETVEGFIQEQHLEPTIDMNERKVISDHGVWQIRPLAVVLTPNGEEAVYPHQFMQVFKEADLPFFLDSGSGYNTLGRYSYLGAYPFICVSAYQEHYTIRSTHHEESMTFQYGENALAVLDKYLNQFKVSEPSPFPFCGGAVGFFSYDLKDEIEKLPPVEKDKNDLLPLWRLAWYDGVVIYDHETQRYWLAACGMKDDGECDPELAKKRLESLANIINDFLTSSKFLPGRISPSPSLSERCNSMSLPFALVGKSKPKEEYLSDLQKVIDYIYAGDIYQVNLSQRFHMKYEGDSWELYTLLHNKNTAPFAAFLPYQDFQILSSSPERFIRITPDGTIQTRPIKGTRPRGKDSEEDNRMAAELYNSEKDKAELTMIVDLERNDLGRICDFGTVLTRQLISLEKYPTVWHLAATIEGRLKKELKPSELLKAIFPGGSITGAPKIRAMEIIDELEPYKRGIYTGSIGYIGFDGSWDLNIVIRTILLKAGTAYVHAGGGIVADSIPQQEYEETIHKAGRLLEILGVIRVEGNSLPKKYPSREISLFETMRITAEGIELPLYHWQRMKKGGELLGVGIPDFPEWLEKIRLAIKPSPTNNLLPLPYALRISVSNRFSINNADAQGSNQGFESRTLEWSMTTRLIPYTLKQYEQGVKVLLLPDRRSDQCPLTYIKSPDLLDTGSALRDTQAQGAFEGIWLNAKGEVMEGTRSNIFFVKDGAIHTPSLQSGCLSGTRRQIIQELADQLQIPFYEGNYRLEDIFGAKEVFLTNALMGIMPVTEIISVREIDRRKSGQEESSVTRRLMFLYHEFIKMKTIQYD